MSEIERARRLVEHRELQLLRASAAARRSKAGRAWVRDRGRKLEEARAWLTKVTQRDKSLPKDPPQTDAKR